MDDLVYLCYKEAMPFTGSKYIKIKIVMKIFIDTANMKDIYDFLDIGLIDGVTTNPSLIAKTGENVEQVIKKICQTVKGPVSAEVVATNYKNMITEGKKLADIASNVVVKLPITWDGLKACFHLSQNNIKTNMTLCFSASQALLAAKAGATYVSPFIGRLDDIGQNGMSIIEETKEIYSNYEQLKTEILVASIRSINHLIDAAIIGAHIATVPPKIIQNLINHPLTDVGLDIFLKDYQQSQNRIKNDTT